MSRDEAWVEAAAARAEAAVPEPWSVIRVEPDPEYKKLEEFLVGFGEPSILPSGRKWFENDSSMIGNEATAAFMAASRTDVPRLCRELLAAWRRETMLRETLGTYSEGEYLLAMRCISILMEREVAG